MGIAYFITGTDTDVGKTVVTAQLLRGLVSQGYRSVGMKPVASGCEWRAGELWNRDVALHAAASNVAAPLALVNPYRFEPPISPHLAAAEAGVAIDLDLIARCAEELRQSADIVLVEGAGGWLAPLDEAHSMADLAIRLDLPVILVVGMRLGCINHARLTEQAIRLAGCRLAGWIANALDPDMARYAENLAYLQAVLPAPLLGEVAYARDADAGVLLCASGLLLADARVESGLPLNA
ncbi:dethiobiotin synthase [Chitinilyticum litopenaei]|uniref:dethiobiotin synthase n=1 Tax=Chitinilyticum litopenaei TaxID=1121276 RepID=UPI0004181A2A|nr:dethiobiotin synthase [Chitinilyticum litopenaei]